MASSLVARARVLLEADTRGFNRDMDAAERKAHTVSRGVKTALTVGLAGAAGALYEVGKAAKIGFAEFEEGQRVAAQTNAVLKSTGGIANVTARDVDRLANALMRKSGVDDEAIKSGQNMLLTFTNIRNETGKGNDVFDQATSTLLDMSVAMGTDMKDQAIQLGKALNDPIAGISALSRVGVTFTDQQKEQIKTLVESGHTLAAQKVILRELQKEFGGSAEAAGKTFGGQIDILRERLNNFLGDVVGKAIPYLQRLADWVNQHQRQIAEFGNAIRDSIVPLIEGVIGAIREIAGALSFVAGKMGGWKDLMQATLGAVIGLWATFKAKAIADTIAVAIANEGAAATVKAAWRSALITTGWGALAVAVGIAVEQIITHWEKVKEYLDRLWTWIKVQWLHTIDAIVEPFSHLPGRLGNWARQTKDAVDYELRKINIEKHLRASEERTKNLGKAAGGAWAAGFLAGVQGSSIVTHSTQAAGQKAKDGVIGARLAGAAVGMAANPGGLKPMILDDLALAQSFGLHLSSGYRPGAVTSTGHMSLHAVGQAIDVAGSPSSMATYATAEAGRSGVAEVLYTPVGGWYPGVGWTRLSGQLARDHYSHVHVGVRSGDGIVGAGRSSSSAAFVSLAARMGDGLIGDGWSTPTTSPSPTPWSQIGGSTGAGIVQIPGALLQAIAQAETGGNVQDVYLAYWNVVKWIEQQLARPGLSSSQRTQLQKLRTVYATRRDVVLQFLMAGGTSAVSGPTPAVGSGTGTDTGPGFGGDDGGGFTGGGGLLGGPADTEGDMPTALPKVLQAQLAVAKLHDYLKGSVDEQLAVLQKVKQFWEQELPRHHGDLQEAGAADALLATLQQIAALGGDAPGGGAGAAIAASILAQRARIFESFGSNIFSGAGGGLAMGSALPSHIFYVKFEKPPPDSYSWIRQTAFAAGR